MHLAKIIDLIAEVAAKQIAKEGEAQEGTPDAVERRNAMIWARLWRQRPTLIAMP